MKKEEEEKKEKKNSAKTYRTSDFIGCPNKMLVIIMGLFRIRFPAFVFLSIFALTDIK